tara:strand:+ start:51 stop:365 length:315 start_codon:yes stop_codon:yes gene_type:complete
MEKTSIINTITLTLVTFIAALLGSIAGTYIVANFPTEASDIQQRQTVSQSQNPTDDLPDVPTEDAPDVEVRTDEELLQDGVRIDEAAIEAQIRALEEEAAQNNN